MTEANSCGCSDQKIQANWIDGSIETPVGSIPRIKTRLEGKDYLGAISMRWGYNRMNYQIPPGLYAAGNPDASSEVLVTANYKLTFDSLRKELSGLNVWILVLDTKGVNVWCAAGKGTFGTKELINRVIAASLDKVVNHKRLILPQLGAVGVSAHKVTQFTRFRVIYGPVYARDIPEYFKNGLKKSDPMKMVQFKLMDRVILTPVELTNSLVQTLVILALAAGLDILRQRGFSITNLTACLPYLGAILTGTVLFPILLPWLPGRSFALKGAILGMIYALAIWFLAALPVFTGIVYLLTMTPIIAFAALNFTGATTFTSQSGVVKETKISLPFMGVSAAAGLVMMVVVSLLTP